jgi:hypothetical protein
MEETIKRTGKESAIVVETVITHILSEKRKRRQAKGGKVTKEWFNNLITKTCIKHNISEGHIRAVGVWNVNDKEVDTEDPKD